MTIFSKSLIDYLRYKDECNILPLYSNAIETLLGKYYCRCNWEEDYTKDLEAWVG